MQVRITRPARKHRISAGRIREALANAVQVSEDGDMAIFVGTDMRGVELEIGLVPDDRFVGPGRYAVVHCMPTAFRR